jgi:hypothetical protein
VLGSTSTKISTTTKKEKKKKLTEKKGTGWILSSHRVPNELINVF